MVNRIWVLVWVSSLLACSEQTQIPRTDESQLRAVKVTEVVAAWASIDLKFPGVVRAVDRSRLSFQIDGVLEERFVELGQFVNQGDPLATLNNPRLDPAVAAAAAQLKELDAVLAQFERDIQRLKRLEATDAVSEERLEQVKSEREAALAKRVAILAQLADAQALQSEATLFAPFSGVIAETPVEIGEFVVAGFVVIEVGGVDPLEVEVELPIEAVQALQLGQQLPLNFGSLSSPVKGTVRKIGRSGRQPGGLFPVVIDFESNGYLRAGMRVDADIPVPQKFTFAVPIHAILDPGIGKPKVYKFDEGRVVSIPVSLGEINAGLVSVDADLQIGDRIVVAGHAALVSGQQVVLVQ